ncbi:CHASE3 domain-containing protein, partial [Polaromonas sp.]|nr:CHASE3 domain-containing protein [Candidatus Saccharibacteria bacterium]
MISNEEDRQVSQLVNFKLQELKETIQLRDRQGSVATVKVVETNKGQNYMDNIRIILSRSDKRIDARLATSLEQSKIQTNKSLLLLSMSTATILALLLGSLYLLHKNLKHQRQAALVIEHDRETTVEKNHYLEAEVSDRLEELERVKSSLEEEVARRTTEL